jgi:predicted RNA-binding Zn-ribbon protein involved in translation (DUF1610 family)
VVAPHLAPPSPYRHHKKCGDACSDLNKSADRVGHWRIFSSRKYRTILRSISGVWFTRSTETMLRKPICYAVSLITTRVQEAQKMRYCTNCGVAVQPGQKFCFDCGKNLDQGTTIQQPSVVNQSYREKQGAETVLNVNETRVLMAKCRRKISPSDKGIEGTLILTRDIEKSADRLVFVTSKGTIGKQYEAKHWYGVDSVTHTRVEKGLLGQTLVVDWMHNKEPLTYRYESLLGSLDPETWRLKIGARLSQLRMATRLRDELVALINSQERTAFDELSPYLASVFECLNPEFDGEYHIDDKGIINVLRDALDSGRIEGFVDEKNRQFIHRVAYEKTKEVININVAAKFEFDTNGALLIQCPFCGAKKPQTEKLTQVACPSCGNTYMIPARILDILG